MGKVLYTVFLAAMWSAALWFIIYAHSVEISLADMLYAGRLFIGLCVGFFVVEIVRSFDA